MLSLLADRYGPTGDLPRNAMNCRDGQGPSDSAMSGTFTGMHGPLGGTNMGSRGMGQGGPRDPLGPPAGGPGNMVRACLCVLVCVWGCVRVPVHARMCACVHVCKPAGVCSGCPAQLFPSHPGQGTSGPCSAACKPSGPACIPQTPPADPAALQHLALKPEA